MSSVFTKLFFIGAVFFIFAVLDLIMLVSLLKPGDERSQIIVWKTSSFTLLAVAVTMVIDVIESFVSAKPMAANPFVQLETAAVIYFFVLMYYKIRHRG